MGLDYDKNGYRGRTEILEGQGNGYAWTVWRMTAVSYQQIRRPAKGAAEQMKMQITLREDGLPTYVPLLIMYRYSCHGSFC